MAVAVLPENPTDDALLAQIPAWWSSRAAAAGLPVEWRDISRALPEFPYGGSGPTMLPEDSYRLGERYVETLAPHVRLREGRHYTPATLAKALWDELSAAAGTRTRRSVIDPAAGAGALLLPVVRQLVDSSVDAREALRTVASTIGGADLDPVAVELGNVILAAELLPLWSRLAPEERQPLPRLLHVGDGLNAEGRAEIVLMNPPYGRVRLDPAARSRWKAGLYGHANRYALFLQAAIERADDGGFIGAIVPTSFLGGNYFQRLRALIGRDAPLRRIVLVEDRARVFVGGVLQETCLAVFERGGAAAPVSVSRLRLNGTAERFDLGLVELDQLDRPWLLPRGLDHRRLLDRARRLPHRLGDYGWHASTGPLVWNRHRAQIHSRRTTGATAIVWAADLHDGRVERDPARDGARYIRLRERDRFMILDEPAVLVQRTTAPEQARRLVVATLDDETLVRWGGGVVVENHVNVLRCSLPGSPLTPTLLAALLRTETLDILYRCISGSVAVSSYELGALPLPDPDALRTWSQLPGSDLDQAVATYYGRHATP